jgi:flavin-binding protein dodecin
MSGHVYKTIQLTGSSTKSADEAIKAAIEKAAKTVHNLRWFKVVETRGDIKDGQIEYWQVTLDVGFTLD